MQSNANQPILRPEIYGLFVLICLDLILFLPMMKHTMGNGTEFPAHLNFAKSMWLLGKPATPHFLYHFLVIAVAAAFEGVTKGVQGIFAYFELAGFWIGLFFNLLLAMILYPHCAEALGARRSPGRALASALLAMSLILVSAINLFSIPSHKLYLGYIGINVFHSSTMRLLMPLSLLLFFQINRVLFSPSGKRNLLFDTSILALLTVLNVLAKPNYIICLLPALAVLVAMRCLKREKVEWKIILIGLVLPAALILLWQYRFTFMHQGLGVPLKVVFAPFQVHSFYSSWLFPKFVLSIAFPAYVYLAYFKEARMEKMLNFAWLQFGFGAFYEYFLAQSDPSVIAFSNGDFFWSGQICLFLLFVATALFFFGSKQRLSAANRMKWYAGASIFALHLVSGLIWYSVQVTSNPVTLWW